MLFLDKMKNSKGSHISFMLSFSIFILFLVFAYTMIGQKEIFSETKENAISNLETNFIRSLMDNVTIVNIFENTSGYDCITIDVGNFENYSSYVVMKNNQIVDSYKTGVDLKIDYDGEAGLFKIYFSENNITHTPLTSSDCITSEIKSVQIRNEIFEKKILSAKDDYLYYTALKNSLGFPYEKDFSFEFEYDNGTTITTRSRPILGEVYVREIPINYFSQNGSYLNGKLRLKVW